MAATNGHETIEKPPLAGEWSYATGFFRVILKDYQNFQEKIKLDNFFALYRDELIKYLRELPILPINRFFCLSI